MCAMCVTGGPGGQNRGWSLGVGVPGSCKSFNMGTGKPSKVFWRHSIPSSAPTLLFEAKSLTAWSSPRRIVWPASDPQGFLCLLASSKIRKHHHTCCCYGCQFFPLFQTLFNQIHCTHLISETLELTGIALAPYTQTRVPVCASDACERFSD